MDEFKIDTFIFCSLAGVSCVIISVTRMAPGVTNVFLRLAVVIILRLCWNFRKSYVRDRVVVPARQATYCRLAESISGLLKSLKIQSQYAVEGRDSTYGDAS